jgi:NADH:ubiquinone oxidoreductase subunit 6 (subunit J)
MKNRIFFIIIAFILLVAGSSTGAFAQEAAPSADAGTGWIDIALYISYILIFICAIAAIVLPLIQSAGDPKALLKSGVGVLAIVVVFGIAYMLSGNEVTEQYRQFGVLEGGSKVIGGGIITVYLLFFIALAAIVYTEIMSIIR